MTKEHFRKEVKWKRIKRFVPLSGTLTRVDLNVPTQQYDYCKTLGKGWQLFDIKAQHNLLLLYKVIKTMVLQTLQTLSYLKLTQSFGKYHLQPHTFLIYIGTPCSCHIPEKDWVHKFNTRIKFCAFQEKMKHQL